MNNKEIIEILRDYKEHSEYSDNILSLGLFGSHARGDDTEISDIDVFVALKINKMFDLIGIKQDLEELTQRNVDIVLLHQSMNKFLRNRILHEGLYV